MRKQSKLLCVLMLLSIGVKAQVKKAHSLNTKPVPVAIAIHGGAGNIKSMGLSSEQEKAYEATLSLALDSGYAVLRRGGSSIDAVVVAIKIMEDSPLFNAGKGSVIANDSLVHMDAAIMAGEALKCGSVADIQHIKNPIVAAKKVMESNNYVFLVGAGAEQFAKEQGVEMASSEYFITDFRKDQFQKALKQDTLHLNNESEPRLRTNTTGEGNVFPMDELKTGKFGTVGCVAIDKSGNLAAGTSTGGLVNKKYNRIGDSPVIGAGTYANNKTCAVSCTGKGEEFIRLNVAHDISALMEYKQLQLSDAVNQVVKEKLLEKKGRGGCIAMDRKGTIYMSFTTSGMFRGQIDLSGKKAIFLYE